MKRPITNLVLGCLVFLALQLNAQTTTFTISPTTVTAAAGTQFTVDITVDDFNEIVSFQYSNNWDPSILEFVEVNNLTTDLPGFTTANIGTTGTANGDLSLSWFDNTVMGVTLPAGTVLYSLTFEVISTTGTDIVFSGDPTTIEIINVQSQEVTMAPNDCEVNGGGGGTPPPPPPSGDLTIIGSDETAAAGSNVCLTVTANDFTDIVSMQFSMHFDESILDYTGVQAFGLQDLTAASFGTTGTGNGDLTVSWFDNSTNGVSLSNGSTLFEVCFDVIGSSGSVSPYTFDGTPTTIEVIDVNSQEVTPAFDAGSVTVDGGTPPPPPPSGDLAIIGSDETAAAGSNVCLDVTANNFTDIVSMQFSMHWDESILEYTGVQGFGLPDLSAASFGTTNTANGDLSVSWFDNTTVGQSIPNGSTLFQVCFDVIGSSGNVSSFTFDGNPTTVEVIESSGTEVTPGFDAGSVTVSGGTPPPPPPVNGFAIIASDETMESGDDFCVQVTVNEFIDIVSMQYTMEWDETLFQYTGVQAFGLPDLSAASFGSTMTSNGVLTMSWFDNTTLGVTLDDGDVIYEVCFTAIGAENCSSSSQFEFTGSAATIEVIEASGTEVTFQGVDGNLTICGGTPPPPPPTTEFTFTAVGSTAAENTEVCVPITVVNAGCITSVQFSMHFDEDILEYQTIQNFGFSDMSLAGNFNVGDVANGNITFSWFDQTTAGISPVDGTTVFEICFNVIGNNGDMANITFDGVPTIVEVIDCSSSEVTPEFANGVVEVGVVNPCNGPVSITNPIVNDVNCAGQSTGTIDISTSGGNGVFNYSWENSSGTQIATSQDITGLSAGQYCVTVTSCLGAETATACYTVGQPSGGALSIVAATTNPACFGDATGSIDVTVSGGTTFGAGCAGYTYIWNDGNTNADRFGIGAGVWAVTVTDCNGCQISESFNLESAPSELTISGTGTAVSCFGGSDGVVTASANGGVGPYEYRLVCGTTTFPFQTSNIFNNVSAGACFLSVRDDFGCVQTSSVVVGTPNQISAGSDVTNATDNCNGAIDLSVNGGTGSLSYSWDGPGGFSASTQDIDDLCPGEYCVTITDANDCEFTNCYEVIAPLMADATPASIEPACFGVCDGEITLNFTGGTGPFTYAWTGGLSGGPSISDVCPGSYTVTVTSSDGQSITISPTVGEANQPVSISVLDVDNVSVPVECDGEILISASGGFGGYTYEWSPTTGVNLNTNNPIQLCLDNYTVTVTDSEGCTAIETPIEVGYNPTLLNMVITSEPICNGATSGQLEIQVTGGLAPYDFVIDDGTNTTNASSPDGDLTVPGLAPGTYTVTVTDAAPGTFQQSDIEVEVVEEVVIELATTTVFPVTNAPANNNGMIDIEVSGGQLPYTFQWSNGSVAQNPSDLTPGFYDLVIVDANGCVAQFENIEVAIFSSNFTAVEPDCPDNNGSITAAPTGSNNTPFTYEWIDEDGNVVGNNETLPNVPVGTYTLTITDTLGRSVTTTYELNSVSNLSAALEVTTDFNGFGVRCNGDASGTASVMANNGVTPYNYQWSTGATTPAATGLPADQLITVVVTDGEGCSVELSTTLSQPDPINTVTFTDWVMCSENSGTATATPNGGVFPYEYTWDDELGQNSQTAVLLDGGVFTVTVIDANGCDDVALAEVPGFIPLELQAVSEPDEGGPNGKAIAVVISGTPPYEFQWNESLVVDSVLTELLPGTYIVKVTDAAGCEDFLSIKVDDATICLDALTIITPEGDGFNEEFKIGCLSRYADNELQIFNRWGQLVYKTTNYSDSDLWRGTNQRGNEVPDGVYFYVFDYLDPVTNTRDSKKGSVTVLRQ